MPSRSATVANGGFIAPTLTFYASFPAIGILAKVSTKKLPNITEISYSNITVSNIERVKNIMNIWRDCFKQPIQVGDVLAMVYFYDMAVCIVKRITGDSVFIELVGNRGMTCVHILYTGDCFITGLTEVQVKESLGLVKSL